MLSCVVEPSTGFPPAPAHRSAGPAVLALTASSVLHSSAQHGFSSSPSSIYMSPLCPRSPPYRKWLFRGGFAVNCFRSVGPAAAARPWTSLCVWCCDDCFTGRFTLIQDRDGKQVLNECCLFSVHVWSCVALQGLAQFSAVSCCIFLFYFLVLLFVDKNQPTVTFLQLRDLVSWNQQVVADLPD